MQDLTDFELHAGRLLRLIRESKELTAWIQQAHAHASLGAKVTDSQEADVRIVESEFANARRALKRLAGVAP